MDIKQIEMVTWLDTSHGDQYFNKNDIAEMKLIEVQTVGVPIHEDHEKLILCISEADSTEVDVYVIPRAVVVKREKVSP